MALIGGQINTNNYPQPDYSGVVNAGQMQAQGLANIGAGIGKVIDNFSQAKKEQKKVDAYNKASAKSIEAAITLGKSYQIKGVEETLNPFLESYNDPNLSPIEKAALLDEGKAMIPNVFGRFDKNQAMLIDQLAAQNRGSGATPSLQRVTRKEVINGQVYDVPTIFNPQTGVTTYEDGTVISNPRGAAGQINSALNFSTVGGDVAGAAINITGEDAPSLLPMPPQTDVAGIQAAIAMPDSNASLANVNPMPPGTPMMTTMPRVDEVPLMQSRPEPQAAVTPPPVERQPSRIPPGAVPVGKQDDIDEIKIIDTDMVKRMGLDPDKVYIAKYRGNKMVSPPELPGQDSKGRMFRLNPETGVVEYIEGVSSIDLNKPPTTNLKEGQALVPDPTSPTGTKIVEIKSDVKEKALNDFSNYITQIGDSYAKLNQMGKAVSAGEANPLNYVFSTPLGQTMGRMFGEKGQPLRDQINTMVPNIINVIRQSSQMGAKGMDSEKELSFYLRSVGDTMLPLEANIKALDALDKAYGKGNAVENILKNYPELAQKVNKYKLSPPTEETGTTGDFLTPAERALKDKYTPSK